MLTIETIKCPCCREEVNSLVIWKVLTNDAGDKLYFHICDVCLEMQALNHDQILMIGFYHGEESYRNKISDFLSQRSPNAKDQN